MESSSKEKHHLTEPGEARSRKEQLRKSLTLREIRGACPTAVHLRWRRRGGERRGREGGRGKAKLSPQPAYSYLARKPSQRTPEQCKHASAQAGNRGVGWGERERAEESGIKLQTLWSPDLRPYPCTAIQKDLNSTKDGHRNTQQHNHTTVTVTLRPSAMAEDKRNGDDSPLSLSQALVRGLHERRTTEVERRDNNLRPMQMEITRGTGVVELERGRPDNFGLLAQTGTKGMWSRIHPADTTRRWKKNRIQAAQHDRQSNIAAGSEAEFC
ncbi:unnamed protein product [Pleuronectes platessa]|uniref:Uncharacterized protein n=1 Tax=Pleuronectes platessa TaxID=8262 RepID=A0A9N7UP07_PLEPL|nr:unnamed protein product [Pleuronectes platessa]